MSGSTNPASTNVGVSFPQDFLIPNVSLDDIPRVKLWGARFFVNQLSVLWKIKVPAEFPNRFVLVSLLDAIVGEVISGSEALRKKLAIEVRAKQLKPWKRRILSPLNVARSDDNWLARILTLRNEGLHGSYLPEEIRITIGGVSPPLDLRLVRYKNGIVADTSLPQDLKLVCDRLEGLIAECSKLIEQSLQEKQNTPSPSDNLPYWFA